MRIAIDYSPAITSSGTGIGRYTHDLIDALLRLDMGDRITLYSSMRPHGGAGFPSAANLRTLVLPKGTTTFLWQRMRAPLPLEVFAGRADLVHGTNFTLPPTRHARRIVTVHDLSFLIHPEYAVPGLARFYSTIVPRAVRSADRIIAVSACTADDLVARLGVARERIAVIHQGVDPSFAPVREPDRLAALDARYGLQHPFVLAVGTIEPRKNYPALIAAFARARQQPGGPRMLAISGRKGWLYDETFAAITKYGVEDAVRFLDFVPDAELATLYSSADVFAMPSLYEGFGLPVIEAMACGTPVVVSTKGSLPEVAGEAGVQVELRPDGATGATGPDGALAEALVRVLTDAELRAGLVARGLERARSFTWERAARAVLDVYAEVTGRGRQEIPDSLPDSLHARKGTA